MFEIGSSLREARMRQGLDFEEMEERTKVRKKYLRHLEDERFDQLPGHTYTKGFLHVYADSLGSTDACTSRSTTRGTSPATRTARPRRGSRAIRSGNAADASGASRGVPASRSPRSSW